MILRSLVLLIGVVALQAAAQTERIIPGPPPEEYVDVTGDGRADLLITSRTVHISDPHQPGFLGLYKLGVRTLSGNAVLMWNTPSNQRWYTLEDSTRLDTGMLSKRIHFKQLSWTDEDHPTEFWLLERLFGPGITTDQDGWYGTGDHHDGHTMVLRSANDLGTSIAAIAFELPFPYGRVAIKVKDAVRVPNGYGEEGDPIPTKPKVVDEFDFGHEASEPQVIIPPGIPPIERVDLTFDEKDDVLIIGMERAGSGPENLASYVRGVSPAPGAAFLMRRAAWGEAWDFYRLRSEETLTPDQLNIGLASNVLMWASPERESVFFPVLQQRITLNDKPQEWRYVDENDLGDPVFRTMHYGQAVIGVVALRAHAPGGEIGLDPQNWVEEGTVLMVR